MKDMISLNFTEKQLLDATVATQNLKRDVFSTIIKMN